VKVLVALALPDRQLVEEVTLAEGATVADAIAASSLAATAPEVDLARLRTGIWSRPCARDAVLREGDRVELYRPLVADPKVARRERARKPRQAH
jgi:putative ubiquitin-RnfH superfamily antitoxin RatB of RatAB toxin-antitoxin module